MLFPAVVPTIPWFGLGKTPKIPFFHGKIPSPEPSLVGFPEQFQAFLFHVAPSFLHFGLVWFKSFPSSGSYLSKEMGLLGNSMGGRQELLAPHPGAAGGIRSCFPTFAWDGGIIPAELGFSYHLHWKTDGGLGKS